MQKPAVQIENMNEPEECFFIFPMSQVADGIPVFKYIHVEWMNMEEHNTMVHFETCQSQATVVYGSE